MPIIKSAKKALRQNVKRKVRNLKRKEHMKRLVKQIRSVAAAKNPQEAEKLLPQVMQALDKAAKTGVIKKNTASRKKSRLAKLVRQ